MYFTGRGVAFSVSDPYLWGKMHPLASDPQTVRTHVLDRILYRSAR